MNELTQEDFEFLYWALGYVTGSMQKDGRDENGTIGARAWEIKERLERLQDAGGTQE